MTSPNSNSTDFSLLNGARRAVVFGKCVLTENRLCIDNLDGIWKHTAHVAGLKHHNRNRSRLMDQRLTVGKRRARTCPRVCREANQQRTSFLARHFTHITWGQLVIHNHHLQMFCLMKAVVRSGNVQAPDTTVCRRLPKHTRARTGFRLGNLSDSRAIQLDQLFEPVQCRQGIHISRRRHRSARLPFSEGECPRHLVLGEPARPLSPTCCRHHRAQQHQQSSDTEGAARW